LHASAWPQQVVGQADVARWKAYPKPPRSIAPLYGGSVAGSSIRIVTRARTIESGGSVTTAAADATAVCTIGSSLQPSVNGCEYEFQSSHM
jgi:hypothetical protein